MWFIYHLFLLFLIIFLMHSLFVMTFFNQRNTASLAQTIFFFFNRYFELNLWSVWSFFYYGETSLLMLPRKTLFWRYFWRFCWVGRFWENLGDVLLWQNVKTTKSYVRPQNIFDSPKLINIFDTLQSVVYCTLAPTSPYEIVRIPLKLASLWLAI